MILNKAGQTWSFKSWQEQEYPEVVDAVAAIKVQPREQFVKQMLEEHDSVRKYGYPDLHYHNNMVTTAAVYPSVEYRSGFRGKVRSSYNTKTGMMDHTEEK
jgi:hypothetical protein